MSKKFRCLLLVYLLLMLAFRIVGNSSQSRAEEADRSADRVVDASTLHHKVMCGYQGWFNCEGDGANLGWTHWARDGRRAFGPGNVTVDLWPELSELSEASQFATEFRHADGRVAKVFSSATPETVDMHFRWMQQYGIDGIFLQRFANGLDGGRLQRHKDRVLELVRQEAEETGRVYAVMYDLSGLRGGQTQRVSEDWKHLVAHSKITEDSRYLHHQGKPLVAVWGIGFNDGRRYSLQECLALVRSLKDSGCSVLLGVPSWWREGIRDATDDPLLIDIIKLADVVSPWSVGRYGTPGEAIRHASRVWKPDLGWCQQHQLDFVPVVFPGFSWHNLTGDVLDQIPRRRGDFLWAQIHAAKQAGAQMLYVAMFDEVDEATAIFKCSSDPPVGPGVHFLDYEGMPSDHYLRLVGQAARGLRGEIEVTRQQPVEP